MTRPGDLCCFGVVVAVTERYVHVMNFVSGRTWSVLRSQWTFETLGSNPWNNPHAGE